MTDQSADRRDAAAFVDATGTACRTYPPASSPESHGLAPEELTLVRDYFGDDIQGPQGFLVERVPPHRTIRAHFHPVHQFQVFFPAPGAWYKRRPLEQVTVHYSDAYVTYGPFGTGVGPMSFFTLRADATGQTSYMPDSIDDLVKMEPRGRNIEAHVPPTVDLSPGELDTQALIPATRDRLAAWLLNAGPGTVIDAPISAESACQYYCVLAGSPS